MAADSRLAAEILLRKSSQLSNRSIAIRTGCSTTSVGAYRRELERYGIIRQQGDRIALNGIAYRVGRRRQSAATIDGLNHPHFSDVGSAVYFIEAARLELVKIGWTDNLHGPRLLQIANTSPARLKLLWAEPGGRPLEREFHAMFAADRDHGEWFSKFGGMRDLSVFLFQKRRMAGMEVL